jgi:hypothetical protein
MFVFAWIMLAVENLGTPTALIKFDERQGRYKQNK